MRVCSMLAAGAAACLVWQETAKAETALDGFRWQSENTEILREGIIWNDRLGDGEDRWKTGGVTQSWLIPEGRLSDERWFEGRASGLEIQARGLSITPDDLQVGGPPTDRPFAQYAGVGFYLRSNRQPGRLGPRVTQGVEYRIGLELGYQGEPLPIFDIQELIHENDNMNINAGNSLGGEFLLNAELRRIWRTQMELRNHDLQFAPFVQGSAGMRENSLRAGMDMIYGRNLSGRTWNYDPAIGALIPGDGIPRAPREGWNWALWVGGDVGIVATDVFLDGGFRGDDPSVDREEFTYRARAGILLERHPFAISYSLTWLSEEFENQPEGQLIGAASFKYRF